jgi:hypothetical protein
MQRAYFWGNKYLTAEGIEASSSLYVHADKNDVKKIATEKRPVILR